MRFDKITQFCLRPPEFRTIIDMVGYYYRWFYIDMKHKLKSNEINDAIHTSLKKTSWIDGLQRKVKLRK